MSRPSVVNLNLRYLNSIPQSAISLIIVSSYRYDRVVRDALHNEVVIYPSRHSYSRFFPCRIETQSLVRPHLLFHQLYNFFSVILNVDDAARSHLAWAIVGSLVEESYRRPLFQLEANVEIVETEYFDQRETPVTVDAEFFNQMETPTPVMVDGELFNQMETLVMVDGGYVFDDLGGGGSRSEAVKELIKKGRFKYRGEGREEEEECAICLENYREGIKVVKMQCLHIFHEKCISKWLKDKDSCPLCRLAVL